MLIDRTSIERIRGATFPSSWAWRGYDKRDVKNFLDALATWLEQDGGEAEQDTAEQELSVQGDAIETLESRIRELERELANAGRRERRLASKLEKIQGQVASRNVSGGRTRATAGTSTRIPARRGRRTTSSWAPVPRGRVDANEASFEQFRGLGLSVSQCARVIATRDIRGGFSSLDDLDDIEGLTPSALRELKQRITLRDG